jgi:hypothetical protein
MRRWSILALFVLLGTSGCNHIMITNVDYIHSPGSPPPQGTVFIPPVIHQLDGPENSEVLVDDAYAWFRLFGYGTAPSAGEADYLVILDLFTKTICVPYTETTTVVTKQGEKTVLGDTIPCNSAFYSPSVHIAMRPRVEEPQQAAQQPLVEIEAEGFAFSQADTDYPLVLELAFAPFPGIERKRMNLWFEKKGDLLCVGTDIWHKPPDHCREPDAPPGVLTSAPTS